jgi:hypothetical protein
MGVGIEFSALALGFLSGLSLFCSLGAELLATFAGHASAHLQLRQQLHGSLDSEHQPECRSYPSQSWMYRAIGLLNGVA